MTDRLSEEQLGALERQYKKIGIVDWQTHRLVFRRPTRDECHAYRVKLENVDTKADALEQFLQQTMVAFDLDTSPLGARTSFAAFLDEQPMFCSSTKARIAMASLSGLVELEDAAELGKGVQIRPAPPARTPEVSPSGSATALEERN
jgi:hypothetical protein